MNKYQKINILAIFTIAYLAIFSAISITINNIEFLYYSSIIFIMVIFLLIYKKKISLEPIHYFFASLLGLFHSLGGNLFINGTKLYDFWIFGLRYDQYMHIAGSLTAAMIAYFTLKKYFSQELRKSNLLLPSMIIMIALGIGATYEIFELIAVAFFGGEKGVGDYINNALDLVFNLIGGAIASIIIIYRKKR